MTAKPESGPMIIGPKEKVFLFLPYLLLFTGSFIYFGFAGNYVGFYQEKLSLFVFSGDYFLDYIRQPGALLIYAGRFLSTFFHSPLLGAFVISFTNFLLSLSISIIYRKLSESDNIVIPLAAGLAVFFLQTNYHFLFYNSFGLCLQLILFLILLKRMNGWLPLLVMPLWYFLTGSFSLVFFMMYTCYYIVSLIRTRWFFLVIFWTLALIVFYISKEFLFFYPARTLFLFPFSKSDTGSGYIPFLVLSGLISLIPLISKIRVPISLHIKIPGPLKLISGSSIMVILLVTISFLGFDKNDYLYFHVEKLFYQEQFNAVVDFLSKNPSQNKLSIYLNNIALCETNRLNDKLFQYRQDPEGGTLFLKWELHGEVLRNGGYFYYTTGMINEAHRWAYENMVMDGLTPEGLRMLIKTELINGNYAVASKYISILRKTLSYRKDAKKFERFLFNDEGVNSDPDLGFRRRTKVSHDFFTLTGDPYANIGMVLSSDSLNRRAFEYKLAYMLIRKDHKGIAEAISKLPMYGFSRIPTHLEEAYVVYNRIYSGYTHFSPNLPISKSTKARFIQFMQTLNAYGNNPKIAEPFLRPNFADTFWYWVFYR